MGYAAELHKLVKTSPTRRSLDDLPNEILLEIVRFVGEQPYLPRKYRVLYSLSLINHRLRDFAFPLLERDICFASSRRFLRVADYWERSQADAGSQQHERLVRWVYITKSHQRDSFTMISLLFSGL